MLSRGVLLLYLAEKEQIKLLFNNSPFTIDELKNLNDHSSKLWAKFRHIENVASLMESSSDVANFSKQEKLMAFTAGQFHDIACISDIALTGKEYGPHHGARGAIITIGILNGYSGFNKDEIKIIATAIANHDVAQPTNLTGFTRTLTLLLRDCDKVDCYRRLSTEPLASTFQKPLVFSSHIRQDFASRCLAGEPIKYSEMQNFNEEALLYIGWFFQLKNTSCQKAALPMFKAFTERIISTTTDPETKLFAKEAIAKSSSILNQPSH